MSITSAVRHSTRRLGLTLAAVASIAGAALFAAAPSTAGPGTGTMPTPCSNVMHHISSSSNYFMYSYAAGRIQAYDQGAFLYRESDGSAHEEQPRSFTEVKLADDSTAHLSVRKNGELWTHTLSTGGNRGTLLSTRWGGITKIVGTDNGTVYGVTSTGGLNAYRLDGTRVRSQRVIGSKGWTSLKSISGYARADGNDSLVAVTAGGELVDYIITPSGAIRASWETRWKQGISQVSVGECDGLPGRPIFVVIGGVMYGYYDKDGSNGTHVSVQDLNNAGRVGAGWTGLLS